MFIVSYRAKPAAGQATPPPMQFFTTVYDNREAAVAQADKSATVDITREYFVLEGISKHVARVEVNVTKP